MDTIARGKAWTFGDNVNTESIMATGLDFDPEMAAKTCLSFYDPEFPDNVQKSDFVVAGENFANSSSRPAGRVLKFLGISAVICESCARIFFRNTWNIGVPILECRGITKIVKKGDELEVDLEKGEIKNVSTGTVAQAEKPISVLVERWKAGGMIAWINSHRELYDTLE